MHSIRRPTWLITIALLIPVWASAKPNFSGEWVMNAAKSDFGPLPAPSRMVRTIQHDEPNLHIKNQQTGAQGEITTELKYTTDGKEWTNTTRAGEVRGTCKWEGETLVVESRRTIQSIEIVQTDRWTLGENGKTMKVESVLKTPQGEFSLRIAFDKQ
ncbi:MAG: hypothetical protein NZV14_14665 [Bryobacteraceae bacterium]|nr:hypothetical protein [Bryobacteraceae bacterium]MDW8379405.1 hypothetical protein [Bryobacterales bacterium]